MPSKQLGKEDATEFLFVQEALGNDSTYGVNVERVLNHPDKGWIIFEFLKLGGPFSNPPYRWRNILDIDQSHPNKYWSKNGRKFVSLWQLTQELDGELLLVNYSVKETETEANVPDDCVAQPYTRINPKTNEEEKVYYYIAKDKGAHVMQVTDIDLSVEFDDSSAEPIETEPIPESENGMTWGTFAAWFREMNSECDTDPREIHSPTPSL